MQPKRISFFLQEVWEEPFCFDKVCHAAELAYVFNVEDLTTYAYTSNERFLSKRMVWYWTNFAKYGTPNGSGMQVGVIFLKSGQVYALLQFTVGVISNSKLSFTISCYI